VPIYRLGDYIPLIDPEAYVHPDAVVIGNVEIGPEASIWPGAVLRGDMGPIVVGPSSSVQDGSVLHAAGGLPTTVGARSVVGHLAHLEGCTLEEGCLVASGATVLHQARISTGAIVGANALVLGGSVVPPGALAVGVPAVIRDGAADPRAITDAVEVYRRNGRRFRTTMRRLD
jgi:carbonic anhydrase/acetyltransferase-like protein (isoleucine patch superfamily)